MPMKQVYMYLQINPTLCYCDICVARKSLQMTDIILIFKDIYYITIIIINIFKILNFVSPSNCISVKM